MDYEFSLKELYDVYLKTTYPMEIAGKNYSKGEPLCVFDKIQISNFNEQKKYISAHGGYKDKDWIVWEDSKGMALTFSQGIFNELQFALLSNSKILKTEPNMYIKIPHKEVVESNENNEVVLSKIPCDSPFFYNLETGEKLDLQKSTENIYLAPDPYVTIACYYYYDYDNGARIVTVGNTLVTGFLRLEGKTRVKDDITGKTRTGIIEIPRLKLMSGLSMRLGENANPVVAEFKTLAVPSGTGRDNTVMNIFFLNNDIDADI